MVQIVPRLGPALTRVPATASANPVPSAKQTISVAAADSTDLGGLLGVLKRNLWRIVLATLAGLALALAYLAVATPVYTATASLLVDPRARKVISEDIPLGGFGSDLAVVESQVSILTSDAVLRRVVEKLNLADDPEFAPVPGTGLLSKLKALVIRPPAASPDKTAQAIGSLAQNIKVKRAQKTYVVDIEVSAPKPDKAQAVAQSVVDAYLADQTSAKAADAKRANELLEKRLGELRDKVRIADTKVDEFKKANRIITSEGGVVTEQQLTKLNSELIGARAAAADAKARQDQIAVVLKSSAGPEVLPDAIRSNLVQRLRDQYAQVARREAALSSQLHDKHPVLIEVRSQLREVKAQIDAELKRVASAAQSEFQIASNRQREIEAQLENSKDEVTKSNTAQIKLRELDQEVVASRELLRLFLSRAKETQEQQNVSTPGARVLTPPSVPAKPSKPMSWLVLALGTIGGLGLGLASALVSDHMDQSMRSANEFAPQVDGQGISTIPALPRSHRIAGMGMFGKQRIEAAQFSDLLTTLSDVNGTDGGRYRQSVLRLLSKIKSQQRPGQPHTVMFASPARGAGNSATALALAYSAALAGERVLLVDAVSNNPELSKVFAADLKPSSVIVLDNKDHLAEITTRDSRSGLSVFPIALADLRTLKTAQRRRLVAGLNALSQGYDLIFIDAGALLEDESAVCLLPATDQVLIVARSGRTTRTEIADTLEILGPGRENLSGGVLTMAG